MDISFLMDNRLKKYSPLLFSLLLVLGIVIIYGPVSHHEFLNYDDNIYVTSNANVCQGLTWANVRWAFSATEAGFWHPLTWLSLMADYTLYRLNAGGYHWTNVLLHAASSLLLFFCLYRVSGALWRSGLVAALFACHPLNVEPVSWVASRKDVLSTFFWMLSWWMYLCYTEKAGIMRYLGVIAVFMMGLMSKPMVATLPCVLLLLDYWPLGRFQRISIMRLFAEKVPLVVLAAIVIMITFVAEQKMEAVAPLNLFPLDVRLQNAAVSYVQYIVKMLWPLNLTVIYPHPGYWPPWVVLSSLLALAFASFIVFRLARRFPYLPIGWLWYLGTLIPVIGIIQIGSHAMADRYAYIPIIGLFIMISWGIADFIKRWPSFARVIPVIVVVVVVWMASMAAAQVRHWQNSITLFEYAAIVKDNHLVHYNLGIAYREKGNLPAAIDHLRKAGKMRPDLANVQNNLGVALMERGEWEDAEKAFSRAIQLQPDHAGAYNNIAMILYHKKDYEAAQKYFLRAVALRPDYANAHYRLALIYGYYGQEAEALKHYQMAVQLNPAFGTAR